MNLQESVTRAIADSLDASCPPEEYLEPAVHAAITAVIDHLTTRADEDNVYTSDGVQVLDTVSNWLRKQKPQP